MQLCAQLHHPNVVTVYDYGEDPQGPFIVMEYLEGETLADRLAVVSHQHSRESALPLRDTKTIARQIAEGLEAGYTTFDVKIGMHGEAGDLDQMVAVARDRPDRLFPYTGRRSQSGDEHHAGNT